jgi:hypothetical protein
MTTNETNHESIETTAGTQSVGDIMQESRQRAIRNFVILAGMLVYLAGVVYAEVHGFSILSKGVNPDFLMWAYLGMVALGISAIALPLALHTWTFEAMHRMAAFGFYVLDIALLGINSFVDFGVNTAETLPQWAHIYANYIMPATPVIAAVGWCVLFLLDPSSRAMTLRHTLRESLREALGQQIIEAAKRGEVTQVVNVAARLEVDKTLSDLFGQRAVVITKPEVPEEDAKPAQDQSFRERETEQ